MNTSYGLSNEEIAVLEIFATGGSAADAARSLAMSHSRAKSLAQHALIKLGVENRRQAVERARAAGLLRGLPPNP